MGSTRRVIAQVTEADFAWKPHDKSMSMGQLSGHLANIPTWCSYILDQTVLDLDELGPDIRPREPRSGAALLEEFDTKTADARQSLAQRSDAELLCPWTLKKGGHEIFTLPRIQRHPQLRDEPHDSPPRTTDRIPPAPQHPGPGYLPPDGGRGVNEKEERRKKERGRAFVTLLVSLRSSFLRRRTVPDIVSARPTAFYAPAMMQRLDPFLFPRDTALLDAQARLTLADETIATIVRLSGRRCWFAAALRRAVHRDTRPDCFGGSTVNILFGES